MRRSLRTSSVSSGFRNHEGLSRVRIRDLNGERNRTKQKNRESRTGVSDKASQSSINQENPLIDVHDEPNDVEDEHLDETIMAIDMRNRDTIGCAYYSTSEETLYVLNDIKYGGIEVVEKLKQCIEPTVVLTSSRVGEVVEEHLRAEADSTDYSAENIHPTFILEVRPSHEFGYDLSLKKILDLDLDLFRNAQTSFATPGDIDLEIKHRQGIDPGLSYVQGHVHQLSSAIDLESRISIGCSGAVLTYIINRKAAVSLPGDATADDTFKVTYLESFGLADIMFLNADTLISMQIFQDDFHPHAHNQGPTNTASGSKQGLSVFGLFQHLTRTPQGRYLLRQYFLRPRLDIQLLNRRHETVAALLLPENDTVLNSLVKSLKNITNMKTTVTSLKRGINNGQNKLGGMRSTVWFRLRSFAYYAIMIEQDIRMLKHADEIEIRHKARVQVAEYFDRRALGLVGRAIIEVIDFGESQIAHRTIVLRGVDPELDEMKRQYDGLEDMLNHISTEIGQTIPQDIAISLNVVFFPQIGFLIAMPVNPVTEIVDYRDPDWEQSFFTSERVYFKDFRMRELDNTVGDIYADICDREIEIVHDLAQRVLQYSDVLVKASEVCAELDCLTALARGAKMYNLVRPTMTDENVINIREGWHVLQAMVVPSCIANNLNLRGGSGDEQPNIPSTIDGRKFDSTQTSLLLLTGPNYSGKSVYLKQNAIITYLAHVGSFVPAAEATIGITDQILTRVSTRETVSKMQSAFLIDLQQVASALYTMTRRSLLIIDEFGKGTNLADGAGLMCGLIEYLIGLRNNRPKVLAATHLHEIFERGCLRTRSGLDLANMEVSIEKEATSLENQVTYLYNILPGRSVSSFGTVCAAMNGVETDIVKRAEYLIVQQARGMNVADVCCEVNDNGSIEVVMAERIARELLVLELDQGELELRKWLADTLDHRDRSSE